MPEHDQPRAWVAMAFDYGRKRIGVATGDSVTRRASPLTTIASGSGGVDWAALARLIEEWRPTVLVVGLPTNADGSPAELTEPARKFAHELERRHDIATVAVDERWSSLEATEQLRQARHSGRRSRRVRHEDIDAASACVILERWFADTDRAGARSMS